MVSPNMRARSAWRFLIAGVVAVVALGMFATIGAATSTIATVAMVDASKTDSEVSGAAAPGSVVRLSVEVSSNNVDRWRSTKWTVGAVSKCQNANRDGDDGRFVSPDNFTLPAAGTAQVVATVMLYPNSDCSGSPSSTKSVTQTIGTRSENGPLTQECARRVVLVLDESGSIGQVQGGIDSVREGARAFVNGLADTGSRLAIIEFNTAARTVPLAGSTYNDITPAYANGAFATYINGQGPRRARATTRRTTPAMRSTRTGRTACWTRPLSTRRPSSSSSSPTVTRRRAIRRARRRWDFPKAPTSS